MNTSVGHTQADGKELRLQVTFGFDKMPEKGGRVIEMFCADFKAGSETQALVMDACVAFSLLLQHGERAADLAARTCSPPSLLGSILRAAAAMDERYEKRRGK